MQPRAPGRLPDLGPRGEGWFAAQLVLMAVVAVSGLLGARPAGPAGVASAIVAIAILAMAGFLGVRALLDLRSSFSPLPRPLDDRTLVVRGVYRFVRHPMYLAVVAGGLGWSLLTGSVAALVATGALMVFFDLKARREERWLDDAYPDYPAYRRRTRRLIPGIY